MDINGGESLQSAKEKLADALVCDPQFTNVIDLIGLEDQRPQLDIVGRVLFILRGLISPIQSASVEGLKLSKPKELK
jgi:hypothetical protein